MKGKERRWKKYSILFTMQPQKANNDGVQDAYPIEAQERK